MSTILPKRFGLRAKLLTGASVLLAFTALMGVLSTRDMSNAKQQTREMYEGAQQWMMERGIFEEKNPAIRDFSASTSGKGA